MLRRISWCCVLLLITLAVSVGIAKLTAPEPSLEDQLVRALAQSGSFRHASWNCELFARRVDGTKLLEFQLQRQSPLLTLRAKEAELRVDDKKAELILCVKHAHFQDGDSEGYAAQRVIVLRLPPELWK